MKSLKVCLLLLLASILLSLAAAAQVVTEYPLGPNSEAGNVCSDSSGNLFFTDVLSNAIGRMDNLGNITRWPLPTANAGPVGCAFGADGLLYFAEQSTVPSAVATLDTTSDPNSPLIREYPMPPPNSGAAGVVFDANGVLNVMQSGVSTIQRMQTDGTFLPVIHLASGRWPHGPTLCGGKVIFAENAANRYASLTTAGVVVEKTLPQSNSKPFAFTCAGDGFAYGTENGVGKIAKVNPTTMALVAQYTIPGGSSSLPMGIATGYDGLPYFAASGTDYIYELSAGTFTGYLVPTSGALPNKVSKCFLNVICFSERGADQIGVLSF